MRVTPPNDIKVYSSVDDIIAQIESQLSSDKLNVENGVIKIIINGRHTAEDRQKVAIEYLKADWTFVSHVATYEMGQPGDLTMFTFIKR